MPSMVSLMYQLKSVLKERETMLKNSKVVLFLSLYKAGQAGKFWTLLRIFHCCVCFYFGLQNATIRLSTLKLYIRHQFGCQSYCIAGHFTVILGDFVPASSSRKNRLYFIF